MTNAEEIKKRLDEIDNTEKNMGGIGRTDLIWLITQIRASLEREAEWKSVINNMGVPNATGLIKEAFDLKDELINELSKVNSEWNKAAIERDDLQIICDANKEMADNIRRERDDYRNALIKALRAIMSDYCLNDPPCGCSLHRGQEILAKYNKQEKTK